MNVHTNNINNVFLFGYRFFISGKSEFQKLVTGNRVSKVNETSILAFCNITLIYQIIKTLEFLCDKYLLEVIHSD